MSIRQKNGTWIVEVYDPTTKGKRHVKARDHDMDAPRTERQARALERAALNARDAARPGSGEETVDSFAARWTIDFPRGEATNLHYAERIRPFVDEHAGRTVRSIGRAEARAYATRHPGRLPALRAMFTDAIEDKLCTDNPFARLGMSSSHGRAGITVLTREEVDRLAELATELHGPEWGPEVAALIHWGAYTCMRPGESASARYSRLSADTYDVGWQFNNALRRETRPKHGSTGLIYVPEPAQRAVLDKPRRLGDDLMFRTKRGKQFRQESLHRAWDTIRKAFTAGLPESHHLRERLTVDPEDRLDFYELRHFGASHMLNDLELEPWVVAEQLRHSDGGRLVLELYGHPSRRGAIDRIRRAYSGDTPTPLRARSGETRGTALGEGA